MKAGYTRKEQDKTHFITVKVVDLVSILQKHHNQNAIT